MNEWLRPERCLPEDLQHAELIGRAWLPDLDGPAVVRVQGEDVFDLSSVASTSSGLLNLEDPLAAVAGVVHLAATAHGTRAPTVIQARRAAIRSLIFSWARLR